MAQSIQRETRSFKGVRIKSNCLSEVRIRLDARCAPVNSRFSMFKEIVNDKVKTNIKLLSREERITAIAQMLSGEKPTAAALENAREMVRN